MIGQRWTHQLLIGPGALIELQSVELRPILNLALGVCGEILVLLCHFAGGADLDREQRLRSAGIERERHGSQGAWCLRHLPDAVSVGVAVALGLARSLHPCGGSNRENRERDGEKFADGHTAPRLPPRTNHLGAASLKTRRATCMQAALLGPRTGRVGPDSAGIRPSVD